MGRDDGDSSERPSHRVKVSTFYIDEHEVTNRQYQFYLRETGRPADPNRASVAEETEVIPADRLDLPAISLTAREARAYCYWANKRLPTEAQWEMAARSSAGHVSYGLNPDAAKGEGDRGRNLEPVMSTPNDRSPFGAFDLAGNAWEWTGDYYDLQVLLRAQRAHFRPQRTSAKSDQARRGDRQGRVEGRLPDVAGRDQNRV